MRWNTLTEELNILSSDNLHMQVDLSLRLRPDPEQVFQLHTQTGPRYYSRVVQQPFRSIALEVLASYNYEQIPKKTVEIQREILSRLRESLEGKHVELDEVEIRHVVYPQAVITATNEKLATQELAAQKEYEKQVAEADAQIQIIGSRGQQEAQEIIQGTLTPLYLQYQALEVQRQLAKNQNAVFYFVQLGADGLPFVVETPAPMPAAGVTTKRR